MIYGRVLNKSRGTTPNRSTKKKFENKIKYSPSILKNVPDDIPNVLTDHLARRIMASENNFSRITDSQKLSSDEKAEAITDVLEKITKLNLARRDGKQGVFSVKTQFAPPKKKEETVQPPMGPKAVPVLPKKRPKNITKKLWNQWQKNPDLMTKRPPGRPRKYLYPTFESDDDDDDESDDDEKKTPPSIEQTIEWKPLNDPSTYDLNTYKLKKKKSYKKHVKKGSGVPYSITWKHL